MAHVLLSEGLEEGEEGGGEEGDEDVLDGEDAGGYKKKSDC